MCPPVDFRPGRKQGNEVWLPVEINFCFLILAVSQLHSHWLGAHPFYSLPAPGDGDAALVYGLLLPRLLVITQFHLH